MPQFPAEGDSFEAVSCSNCACGSTISLNCGDAEAHAAFMMAVKAAVSGGADKKTLLAALRDEVRARASR